MGFFKDELKNVKAFVFDVDGVFTDGMLIISGEGIQSRSMNVKDGYAVHYAAKMDFPIAIITGGQCKSVITRFEYLGVKDVYISSHNKMKDLEDFLAKKSLNPEDIFYVGDDLPDFHVMKIVGLCACPADAAPEIKEIAHYISPFDGGKGCVRDIIEQTLKAQGKWLSKDAFVW